MKQAAGDLEFEEAARFRDEIKRLEAMELEITTGVAIPSGVATPRTRKRLRGP